MYDPDKPVVGRANFKTFAQYARSQRTGTQTSKPASKNVQQALRQQLKGREDHSRPDMTYPYLKTPAELATRKQRRRFGARRYIIPRRYGRQYDQSEAILTDNPAVTGGDVTITKISF